MSINITNTTLEDLIPGWVDEPDGRGTWSILSTCLLTIILCCWTSVYPNIPAEKDGEWDRIRDKLHLALTGILGPEFLLMLALGQWSSARASVKDFWEAFDEDEKRGGRWTLSHAFYADMGGFRLEVEGVERAFPVNAKQLLFLVKENYVEFPAITEENIGDMNKSDRIARLFAVCQALWLVVNCIERAAQNLALTTLELTTISFVVVFFATSFCWYHKPSDVATATTIRSNTHINTIRANHSLTPHAPWHKSPLDFLREEPFFCDIHWRYYNQILYRLHLPIFSRPVTTRLWDRIPSDTFPMVDKWAEWLAAPIILLFGAIFMVAWNFQFPSVTEQILWRVASSLILFFAVIGGLYSGYCHKFLSPKIAQQKREWPRSKTILLPLSLSPQASRAMTVAAGLRNNDPYQDPAQEIPLRVLFTTSAFCALYCLSRGFILVEDFIGLRSLPASAFQDVSWSQYIPHLSV